MMDRQQPDSDERVGGQHLSTFELLTILLTGGTNTPAAKDFGIEPDVTSGIRGSVLAS